MAAPRPYDGFDSCWTWVRGLPVHDRRATAAAGVPVVLVHGLAVSHRYLMPFARSLAARHRVHVIDLPGFGLSGEPGRVLDLPELSDVLGAWLDAVGLRQPVLGGNSFGCQVVVDLVAQRPAAAQALVLIGPTMDPRARTAVRQAVRWLRNLRHEDPSSFPVIARDVLVDAGVGRALRTYGIALRDRIEDKLPAVRVPALVTRGDREQVVPQRWAQEAAALLPHGELAVVPDCPHDANYSAPERLAAVVLPFLARATAGPTSAGGTEHHA